MLWIFFSVLVAILWSVCSLIDKYILDKYIDRPNIYVIFTGFAGLIASIIILIIQPVILPFYSMILSFITGFVYMGASIYFFKALQIEETSRISPLASLSGIFILILSYLFLDEALTPIKYLGVSLLVFGAFLISVKKGFKLRNEKALWFMIIATTLAALYSVSTKYLLRTSNHWVIFSYTNIGYFISTIPLTLMSLSKLKEIIEKGGQRFLKVITVSRIVNLLGLLSLTAAIAYGQYVSLVVGMSKVQPIFVLFFSSILSIFFPHILKEEMKGSVITLKIVAIVITIIGAFLVT